ncbi:protein translocase subunit [Parasponia andersonii]|uniref:Protein translocase subunit n=1 Tax=Parasponia andersonii TaxID=3476 RepID=A0A2P5DE21_PARAD|nr:protein translocase subunit [Parasponia andersonii]
MGFGALRPILRPLSRTLVSQISTPATTSLVAASASARSDLRSVLGGGPFRSQLPWFPITNHFHSLTDTRFPKRRPSDKPRRKRASMKPPGPYAFVQYVPGEPILPNRPNEGSVKRRNEKKRIRQRLAFILAEKKKRKAQLQEAKRKKNIKKIERKMAAVAREREWAQRLAELQRLEEEKKKSMA